MPVSQSSGDLVTRCSVYMGLLIRSCVAAHGRPGVCPLHGAVARYVARPKRARGICASPPAAGRSVGWGILPRCFACGVWMRLPTARTPAFRSADISFGWPPPRPAARRYQRPAFRIRGRPWAARSRSACNAPRFRYRPGRLPATSQSGGEPCVTRCPGHLRRPCKIIIRMRSLPLTYCALCANICASTCVGIIFHNMRLVKRNMGKMDMR